MAGPLTRLRHWWRDTWRNEARTTRDLPQATSGRSRALNVAGIAVDESNALTLAAVWCAVRAISEPLSAMPYHVYQRSGKRRDERRDHPVDWLLSMQPNPEQTAFDFWDCMAQRMLSWGNAYAEIERNQRGEPAWLWPIEPWRVFVNRNAAGGLEYQVTNHSRDYTVLDPANVYHLHGPGDGLQGWSVVGMARESIALGLTMEQFGAAFFGNGAQAGAVISAPAGVNLSKEAVDAMLEEFNLRHGGARKAFKAQYLDKGMTVDYPSVPPEDAQFLQSRKFNVIEVARWFRVPPHLLYELDRATFSNIEHQSLEYVIHTLLPWARRIEMQTDVKLFGRTQRGAFYSRFNFDGLLRGDVKSRFDAYSIAHQNAILSANDIRELEDMNPVPGGDLYVMQSNMIPADQLRELTEANIKKAKAPPPAPAQAPGGEDDEEASEPGDQPQPNARVLELVRRYAEARR